MPNWKKVIVSGSDAALNSLNVTTALTASGNIYPTGLGEDRQILKTDGLGNITFGYPEEVVAFVKNVSGVTLFKGTPVHATQSGAMGNVVGVIAASASNASTMPATFVLNETLANEAEGEALASGFIQGVNTSGFEVGDIVYVGSNSGYTNIKPTGSNLIQNLGIVTKVDATNGSGYVLGAGRSNDIPNISPGHVWVGNSNSVPVAVLTSSLSVANAVSSSFAVSASWAPGSTDTNFANTDLTFTGARAHDTNGNILQITTDNNGFEEAWFYMDRNGGANLGTWIGWENNYIRTYNQGIQYITNDNQISQTGSQTTFNTTGQDVNFRINGIGTNPIFFMSGSQNRIGINKSTPNSTLDISGSTLITGSLTVTGGITGSLLGTASFSNTSSFCQTSSYSTISEDTINKTTYTVGLLSGSETWAQSFDGTMTLPTCSVVLYDNAFYSGSAKIYNVDGGVTGTGGITALVDNDTNYIFIDYNNGTPVWDTSTTNITNNSNIALIYIIYRLDTFIHVLDFGNQGVGLPNKLSNRIVATQRFARESGLVLGLSGSTGVVTVSEGVAWNGTNRQTLNSIASDGSTPGFDVFFKNYHVSGQWETFTFGSSPLSPGFVNNEYYDDGTDIVLAGDGKYLVNWYYRGQETNDHIYEVYGNNEYDTISEAQVSLEPPLPELITSHAFLLGRIIIQKDFKTGIIESAFTQVFQSTTVQKHNDLSDIQGGTAGEYYHITANEAANLALTNINNNFTSTQTITGSLAVTGETTTNTLKVLTVPTGSTSNQILTYNTSSGQIERKTDTGGSPQSKAISVPEPTATDDITLFFTNTALTISSVVVVLRGTSPSITFSLSSGGNRTTVTTNNVNGQTVTNTTTGTSVTLANTAVSANNFIWLRITAISGTVTEAHFTINYTT